MKIKYFLEKGAYAPQKAHEEDAGFDLRTPVNVYVPPHDSMFIDTGIHVEIPVGYVGMIKSKSGLNVKGGLNTEGVIDAGYKGSIGVKIYNHSNEPYRFNVGDKITQLVIMPIPMVELAECEKLDDFEDSARGCDGFGSTGK